MRRIVSTADSVWCAALVLYSALYWQALRKAALYNARCPYAKVAELVDALVLGTSVGRRESSSLSFRTTQFSINVPWS